MEGGEAAEEGPALWVGAASLEAERAETKGPAGEELPDSPSELPNLGGKRPALKAWSWKSPAPPEGIQRQPREPLLA